MRNTRLLKSNCSPFFPKPGCTREEEAAAAAAAWVCGGAGGGHVSSRMSNLKCNPIKRQRQCRYFLEAQRAKRENQPTACSGGSGSASTPAGTMPLQTTQLPLHWGHCDGAARARRQSWMNPGSARTPATASHPYKRIHRVVPHKPPDRVSFNRGHGLMTAVEFCETRAVRGSLTVRGAAQVRTGWRGRQSGQMGQPATQNWGV